MECTQHVNPIPIWVDLVPDHAMTGRLWMRVMIVMPAFAPGQQCDPKAVSGAVIRAKTPRAPHVSGRVYQPSSVEPNHTAQENSPHHALPASKKKNRQGQSAERNPMPLADQ